MPVAVQIDPARKGPKYLAMLETTHGPLPATVTQSMPDGTEWRYFVGTAPYSYPLANGVTVHPCANPPSGVVTPAPTWVCTPPLGAALQPSASPAPIFDLTDSGNAAYVANLLYGRAYRLPGSRSKWLSWDGDLWRDADTPVQQEVRRLSGAIRQHAVRLISKQRAKALAHADYSASERGIKACLSLLESDPSLQIGQQHTTAHPVIIQCGSLHVDLKTKTVGPVQKDRFFTVKTGIEPDFSAPPTLFLRFLDDITQGDVDLQRYMHLLFGYCLTGYNVEQFFWFITGPKNNGKTTLLEIIDYCMGDYAATADEATFFTTKQGIRNDLAALRYARMISVRELRPGTGIDEATIRRWTGGDPINARFLYAEEFTFRPVGKLIVLTNHFPVIRGDATWRRVRIIPLTYDIPESKKDIHLGDLLRLEAPRILAWLIEGAHAYLNTPGAMSQIPAVMSAYRDQMQTLVDPVRSYLARATVSQPGASTPAAALYEQYRNHANATGVHPYSYPSFIEALRERGIAVRGLPEIAYDVTFAR
jgi:putative DNA primase/helicase